MSFHNWIPREPHGYWGSCSCGYGKLPKPAVHHTQFQVHVNESQVKIGTCLNCGHAETQHLSDDEHSSACYANISLTRNPKIPCTCIGFLAMREERCSCEKPQPMSVSRCFNCYMPLERDLTI